MQNQSVFEVRFLSGISHPIVAFTHRDYLSLNNKILAIDRKLPEDAVKIHPVFTEITETLRAMLTDPATYFSNIDQEINFLNPWKHSLIYKIGEMVNYLLEREETKSIVKPVKIFVTRTVNRSYMYPTQGFAGTPDLPELAYFRHIIINDPTLPRRMDEGLYTPEPFQQQQATQSFGITQVGQQPTPTNYSSLAKDIGIIEKEFLGTQTTGQAPVDQERPMARNTEEEKPAKRVKLEEVTTIGFSFPFHELRTVKDDFLVTNCFGGAYMTLLDQEGNRYEVDMKYNYPSVINNRIIYALDPILVKQEAGGLSMFMPGQVSIKSAMKNPEQSNDEFDLFFTGIGKKNHTTEEFVINTTRFTQAGGFSRDSQLCVVTDSSEVVTGTYVPNAVLVGQTMFEMNGFTFSYHSDIKTFNMLVGDDVGKPVPVGTYSITKTNSEHIKPTISNLRAAYRPVNRPGYVLVFGTSDETVRGNPRNVPEFLEMLGLETEFSESLFNPFER